MSKLHSTMTSIANNIRNISGTTDLMNLDDIASNLGGINTEVYNQSELIGQIIDTFDEKASYIEDLIIERTIRRYENNSLTTIGGYIFNGCKQLSLINVPNCTVISENAFCNCFSLTSISFPNCITIGFRPFQNCSNLISIDFPNCTNIGYGVFAGLSKLTSVNFPKCTLISDIAFYSCSNLTSISFPNCNIIRSDAFTNCYRLSQLYLTGSFLCNLTNSNAFNSTPFTGYSSYFSGTPYIYVPESLVTSYQNATNWTYFSSYFSAYEDIEGGVDYGN